MAVMIVLRRLYSGQCTVDIIRPMKFGLDSPRDPNPFVASLPKKECLWASSQARVTHGGSPMVVEGGLESLPAVPSWLA